MPRVSRLINVTEALLLNDGWLCSGEQMLKIPRSDAKEMCVPREEESGSTKGEQSSDQRQERLERELRRIVQMEVDFDRLLLWVGGLSLLALVGLLVLLYLAGA